MKKKLTTEERNKLEGRILKRFLRESQDSSFNLDVDDFMNFLNGDKTDVKTEKEDPESETPVVDVVDAEDEFYEEPEEAEEDTDFDFDQLNASMGKTTEEPEIEETPEESEPEEFSDEEMDLEPEEGGGYEDEEFFDNGEESKKTRKYVDAGRRENQADTELDIQRSLISMYRQGRFDKEEGNEIMKSKGWNLEAVKENGPSQIRYVYKNRDYISKANIFVDRNTGRIIGVSVKAD